MHSTLKRFYKIEGETKQRKDSFSASVYSSVNGFKAGNFWLIPNLSPWRWLTCSESWEDQSKKWWRGNGEEEEEEERIALE